MKEFIEKLISRLEEKKREHLHDEEVTQGIGKINLASFCSAKARALDGAIEIVNQLAEEYAKDTNVSTIAAGELLGKTEQVNDGWIPYTDKSYPKVGRIIDVWLTLEDGVYKAVWNGSDFEWENGRAITDKIFAWMDNSVPKPYQPKGDNNG